MYVVEFHHKLGFHFKKKKKKTDSNMKTFQQIYCHHLWMWMKKLTKIRKMSLLPSYV